MPYHSEVYLVMDSLGHGWAHKDSNFFIKRISEHCSCTRHGLVENAFQNQTIKRQHFKTAALDVHGSRQKYVNQVVLLGHLSHKTNSSCMHEVGKLLQFKSLP